MDHPVTALLICVIATSTSTCVCPSDNDQSTVRPVRKVNSAFQKVGPNSSPPKRSEEQQDPAPRGLFLHGFDSLPTVNSAYSVDGEPRVVSSVEMV
ncbi:hypothetical protein EDB87DRAFT_1603280 [Lactarius vividus]|nr:hypothetical protein EDB87DRAFT_1603280 [Lactarius vividus]